MTAALLNQLHQAAGRAEQYKNASAVKVLVQLVDTLLGRTQRCKCFAFLLRDDLVRFSSIGGPIGGLAAKTSHRKPGAFRVQSTVILAIADTLKEVT